MLLLTPFGSSVPSPKPRKKKGFESVWSYDNCLLSFLLRVLQISFQRSQVGFRRQSKKPGNAGRCASSF
ncbi:hypothetical protein V6N11_026074 [Hibiscus sabdariffa]|uniref:Uncharacterized protein n=1 Tax=Hibiscus sabdariffa TaxID=183260 RepID=A0ABR2SVA0_9ROSI